MDNTLTPQKKRGFFQSLAEFAFMIYMITLYVFVDKKDTVAISQIAFVIFSGLTALVILQRQRIHLGKNVMIVYLTFAWILASYFWAQNQYLAWTKIKTMWQLFLLFFLVYNLFNGEDAYEYLLKCLYIAGISLLGYSVYTYGLGQVIDMMTGSIDVRLGKDINQENTFGILNATTCMVAFYYMFYRKRYKLFHIAVFVLAFLFAMSSGSRKALLIICAGVLFLTYKKYGIRQVYKVIAIVLVLSILFVSVIQLPVFDTINYRMEQLWKNLSGEGGGDSSSLKRSSMISDGWNIFKQRVLTGYGADNYRVITRHRTYAHNNFIEILVDFGLIGFILYYMIYWNVFKNLKSAESDESKAMLCIFVVRLLMEMAMVPYYDKIHWIMMAFFLMKPIATLNEDKGATENGIISEKNKESYT